MTHLALLAVLDAAWIFVAFFVTVYLQFEGDVPGDEMGLAAFIVRAVIFITILMLAMAAVGLYRTRQSTAFPDTVARLVTSVALASIVHAVVYYAIAPEIMIAPTTLAVAHVVAMICIGSHHWLFDQMAGSNPFKRNVLILGTGNAAAQLTRSCTEVHRMAFRVAGFVAGEGDAPNQRCIPRVDRPSALLEFARANKIHEIVVAVDDRRQCFPSRELLDCRLAGISVTEAVTFIERETGKIDLDVLRPSWLIYGRGFRRGSLHNVLKRIADLLGSILLVCLTLPLLGLAILAIAIESKGRGAILYRQKRVGYQGKPFELLKLRTMVPEAEADGRARWASANDCRVTRVGALLRRFRIDELPQVINILKGEMSFVGPRPERPEFVAELCAAIPYYGERHWVKPGLTGWAQLCYPYGSSVEDARQKLQYDLYYIKHESPTFDFGIILQTLEVVLWGSRHPSFSRRTAESTDVRRAA